MEKHLLADVKRGLNGRAIIIGWLVDTLGSIALGAVISGITMGLVLGVLMVTLGAYVAARIAGRSELVHAFAVGALAEVTGILLLLAFGDLGVPRWYIVCSLLLMLPFAMLGGVIRRFEQLNMNNRTGSA
jgi:hypothetical protein